MKLYEIAAQHAADIAQLEALDLDDQTFADTLESIGGDLETKVTSTVAFALTLDAEADAIEKAAERMCDRAAAVRAKAERVREYVLACMKMARVPKEGVKCPYFVVKVALNNPSVVVDDIKKVPNEFFRLPPPPPMPEPTVDKKRILEVAKSGVEVPGTRVVRTERLSIK